MNKFARLGFRLAALLVVTPLVYVVATVVSGDRAWSREGGILIAFLPLLAVAIGSMYAIHDALYSDTYSRSGRIAFHVLNVGASLLLVIGGALIAFVVQIQLVGM